MEENNQNQNDGSGKDVTDINSGPEQQDSSRQSYGWSGSDGGRQSGGPDEPDHTGQDFSGGDTQGNGYQQYHGREQAGDTYQQPYGQYQTGDMYQQPYGQYQTGDMYRQSNDQNQTGNSGQYYGGNQTAGSQQYYYGQGGGNYQTYGQQGGPYQQTQNQNGQPYYGNQTGNYRQYDEFQKKSSGGNGFGIASMILGILSLVLFCTCFNIPLAIAAVVFGVLHLGRNTEGRAMAVAGIASAVLSVLAFIITIVLLWGPFQSFYWEVMQEMPYSSEYRNDHDSDFDFDADGFFDFPFRNDSGFDGNDRGYY